MSFWDGFFKTALLKRHLEHIERAVSHNGQNDKKHRIEIHYKKLNGRTVKRKVTPYTLTDTHLGGFDHKREEFRSYILEKLRHVGHVKQAFEKRPYKTKPIAGLDPNNPSEAWTAKIDGALTGIEMKKDQIPALFSHRTSKRTGGKLSYNEKLPHIQTKSPFNAFVRGETYATVGNKPVAPELVGAILNSKPARSLELQKQMGYKTRTALIDIDRFEGKDVSKESFSAKRQMLESIAKLNPDFELPEMATTSKAKLKLLERIRAGKHPQTAEGLVTHDLNVPGSPFGKAKLHDEHDVYVTEIFPEEEVKAGRKPMAGGFLYAWEPGGKPAGRVGTGFDHAEKLDMLRNPDKYIGRVARVKALAVSKNKALQKPSFSHWHVEKNLEPEEWAKQTVIVQKSVADSRDDAKNIAKGFADRMYTSRETGSSFRFRQLPPSKFDPDSFKTFNPKPGISIVYGKLK